MANSNKSLEIRINSIDDAKSVVAKQASILATFAISNVDSIEFLIAEEIKDKVNAIIRGVYRVKNFTSYVSTRDGNTLYQLPHFAPRQLVPIVQAASQPSTVIPVKRMPRSKTLKKIVNAQAVAS